MAISREEFKTELENLESRIKLVERQLGQIKDIINDTTEKTNSYMQITTKSLDCILVTESNILKRIEGLEKKFKIP